MNLISVQLSEVTDILESVFGNTTNGCDLKEMKERFAFRVPGG